MSRAKLWVSCEWDYNYLIPSPIRMRSVEISGLSSWRTSLSFRNAHEVFLQPVENLALGPEMKAARICYRRWIPSSFVGEGIAYNRNSWHSMIEPTTQPQDRKEMCYPSCRNPNNSFAKSGNFLESTQAISSLPSEPTTKVWNSSSWDTVMFEALKLLSGLSPVLCTSPFEPKKEPRDARIDWSICALGISTNKHLMPWVHT